MEFRCVAMPQNESELAVMVCTLEAYGISHYVQNQGFGGLYPGMQMDLYNCRRLMVRADQAEDARILLNESVASSDEVEAEVDTEARLTVADRLRVIAELLLFGWSVPARRRHFAKK